MSYIGNTPGNVFGQGSKDSFNGDGSTTAFTMSKSVLLATDIDVFVGNVRQEPNVAYSVSGATLTFTGTPSSGTGNIYVVHKATSLGTLVPPTGIAGNFTTLTASGTLGVTGAITQNSAAVKVAGKESIWIPALAMKPTASNGCSNHTVVETTSGRPDMIVLDFDKDSDEFAQFNVAFPKSWNAGTVTFQFYWSGIAATTGVAMNLQGVAFADNDSIDTAYGTAVVVQDDAQGAVEELLVSAESSAITIAGSPGANELTYFRIGRDVSDSNDDMAGDCRLHGIKLFFSTNAANDA